ncbi:MAG: glycerophosphodiester phosphodiesterase [Nitrospinae bacterium]|nr:glycerophosphodiester phosphodiesterase [Nitrospinota bacterium]
MDIIAHRGDSSLAPENTLAAIGLAWDRGADGVEIDVRLSKDRRIVAVHDETAKRAAGKNWAIASHTLAELQTLDVGGRKNREWSGERIPALDEVLAVLPADKKLIVEIKCGEEILPVLEDVLARPGNPEKRVALAGFSLTVMSRAKKLFPNIPVYWNAKFARRFGAWRPAADDLIHKAGDAGMDGLSLKACGAITSRLAHKAKHASLSLHVWTVDSPALAKTMAHLGVDSLITNHPGWIRAELTK